MEAKRSLGKRLYSWRRNGGLVRIDELEIVKVWNQQDLIDS